MLLTSLFLDYSTNLFTLPVVNIDSQLDVNQLNKPELSAKEYQVKIKFPANTNLPKRGEISFNIPTHPSLQSKVRVQLPPSIGYGINSCYTVEYYEWQRPYEAGKVPYLSKIQKQLVHTEYWRVPTSDKFYLLSYNDYYLYKSNSKVETIKLTRTNTNFDLLIDNLDVIDIKSITQNGIEFTNWKLIDNSLYWRPYFEPLVNPDPTPSTEPTVAIEWLNGDKPVVGSEYEVSYIKPLTLEDIVYVDYENKTILSNYGYANYSLYANSFFIR